MLILSKELCVTMGGTSQRTKVLRPDQPAKEKGKREMRIMKREDNHRSDQETSTGADAPV